MLSEYYHISEKKNTWLWSKKGVQIYTYKFEFLWETKQEYLSFVTEWKADWKKLSRRLKAAKLKVKEAMRAGVGYRDQEHVKSLKEYAWMLLEMRLQAKIVSWEQAKAQSEAVA